METHKVLTMDLRTADELRAIAQRGLQYARDDYDRERYGRILELAARPYAQAAGLPDAAIVERFRTEVGYPTAKVGTDAAIFDEDGRLLLIERPDSGKWALPGGWVDPGQSAEETVVKEVLEETTLSAVARCVIAVNTQLPTAANGPHTSVHVLYHCEMFGAQQPATTAEARRVEFCQRGEIRDWHQDHGDWAEQAWEWSAQRRR